MSHPASSVAPTIRVEHLTRSFGRFRALDDVSLAMPAHGITALLGPSGSGKTTLLRILAGLDFADGPEGRVHFGDRDVTGVPSGRRGVGLVFQHYALFRHLSVLENVAFGLRVRPRRDRPTDAAIRARAGDLLARVGLAGLESRQPWQLSGGQRQRVALARALAVEPGVLLLDEPFGALDARVRQDLRRWLRELHRDLPVTTVFVTHDQEEALEIADRVVILNRGRVEQEGTPEEVYDRPANRFVLEFLGNANRLPDEATFVRPSEVELLPEGDPGAEGGAVVVDLRLAGPVARALLRRDDGTTLETVVSRLRSARLGLAIGVRVGWRLDRVHRFEPAAGPR